MAEGRILAAHYPELAKQWNYEKNGTLTPWMVTAGSRKKVWWTCPTGHTYEQSIANRTLRNLACPYCSRHKLLKGYNDLETMFPEIAKEWHPTKNGSLTPRDITARNSGKVWWVCSNGHEWEATIASRTDTDAGRGCPYCSNRKLLKGCNDLETKYPDIAKEWDYEKNEGLLPSDVIAGTPKKVWWKCSICGHEYYAQIASRTTMASGCPNCAKRLHSSFPEQAILFYIRKAFQDVINSYHTEWLGKLEIDIYIPGKKTGIEYDGIHWHDSQTAIKIGKKKYALCRAHNVRLVRVSEFIVPKDDYCDSIIIRKDKTSNTSLEECINQLFSELGLTTMPEIDLLRDNTEIISNYYTSLKENSLQVVFPKIAEEWDFENNHGITPDMVSAYSNEQFYWKCINNHTFKKAVYERTRTDGKATGCPFCSNKRVLAGYNDLLTFASNFENEWDYEKNYGLSPSEVLPKSAKKVWWICPKGHSYIQAVYNHVLMHQGCPICAGKLAVPGDNDLATKNPELLKEWNYDKNKGFSPTEVTAGSSKKIWWICPKGHSYQASVNSRAKRKTGCPYCTNRIVLKGFNDLATLEPDIAKEWDYEKNAELLPDGVASGSHENVWWKCSICGESWKTAIVSRTKNHSGCPNCSRKNATKKLQLKVKCIETGRVFDSAIEAAAWLGVSRSLINACVRGRLEHAGGYHWMYYKADSE